VSEQLPDYDELRLRIEPGPADGEYRLLASGPDGATASGTLELPFSEVELDNFVLRVGRTRRGRRGYRSPQMEEAKQFGADLFDSLMVGGVRDVFRSARGVADHNRRGLRVTLYLTDVPELMGVPWEFLYDRPRFLAQSIYSPVVRSLDIGEASPARPATLPLRVLGLVSRPQGFETLDVESEKEKLAAALAPLCERRLVTLEWLDRATLEQLDEVFSRRDEIHILHYIGHGAYESRTDGGILVLEDARGGPHEITGEELGSLVQDERSLRLVVLNSCEGARSSHVDPFSGVATSLVQYGIPAVVGMQFEITDEAAIAFAARLYAAIAEGYPVDAALAQSRRAIFAAGNDIEFGTPVLFLRGSETQLFDLENPAPPRTAAEIQPLPADSLQPPSVIHEHRPSPPWVASAQPPAPAIPPPVRPYQQRRTIDQSKLPPRLSDIEPRRRRPLRRLIVVSVVLLAVGIAIAGVSDNGREESNFGEVFGALIIVAGFGPFVWAGVRALNNRSIRTSKAAEKSIGVGDQAGGDHQEDRGDEDEGDD
jgi:hypothetical protein